MCVRALLLVVVVVTVVVREVEMQNSTTYEEFAQKRILQKTHFI